MNKQQRIKEIEKIRETETSDWKIEIPWKSKLEPMAVYKIPMHLLVYNKYNGRILSRTKSLENQARIIDAETDEGRELIEELLDKSNLERNKKTKTSIEKYGQQKVGIITKEGIIIDGNRRAMLINKIDHIDHFKAVILPVTLEESPIEIERLETFFQLGEDRKLDYNPIEIYLKTQSLYLQLSKKDKYDQDDEDEDAIKQIYEWIGDYKTDQGLNGVRFRLDVMNKMDDYLDYLEYNNIYTPLDNREDQFRRLTGWLSNYYGENSGKPFDGYSNIDVDDLKTICYDFIRLKYEGKKFRYLGHGQRGNHFFGDKDIWNSFSKKHDEITGKYVETPIDYNSANIERHLESRDSDFKESIGDELNENVDLHYQHLRNRQESDKPEKLLSRAIDSFDAINKNHKAFSQPSAQKLVAKLGKKVLSTLQKKSPARLLSHVIQLLEGINVDEIPESEREDVHSKTKRIQQIGYQINKQL